MLSGPSSRSRSATASAVARAAVGREPLELGLDLGEHLRVEELAQLGATEELGEQALVQGQRGGPALGDRGVALVDELGDVAEEQAAGVGARRLGGDVDDGDLATLDTGQQRDQRGQVVDVLEALADRLEDDREGRVLGGDLEQLGAALALLPQGAPAARVAAGEQQRPGRALAEAAREQRGTADLLGDELLDLVGLEDDDVAARRLVLGVGDADDDAVVGGDRLAVDVVALPEPRVDGQRPGRVHRCAVGRVDDEAPVAELVAEPLDQQLGVAGQRVGRLLLLGDVGDQVAGGVVVEAAVARLLEGLGGRGAAELAGEAADRLAQLGGAAERVALPEREAPGDAGGGRDQHPVVGDVLDPPAGRAEREDVADPRLVDHLLVELADPARLVADEEDAEEAAVGDGAAARDGQPLGAGPTGEHAGDAVPHDARSQLGELLAGVAAAEQVEGRVEGAAGEGGVGSRAADEVVEVVDLPVLQRRAGHDLLGEDVERVGGDREGLDRAAAHPLDRDRGLREVAAVLGEEDAAADLAHLVAGPADPLEGAGDAGGRLDLDDQVDGTHVDAELEAARGDDAGEPTPLEVVLDEGPLLLGDRAVVGLGDDRARAAALPGLGHHLGRRPGVGLLGVLVPPPGRWRSR